MDKTELFIEIVRKNEMLWNLNHSEYKNMKQKVKEWNKIAEYIGWPFDACKRKWKALRDSFSRENGKRSQSGDVNEEVEGWKFYHQMSFLKEHMKHRPYSGEDSFTRENEKRLGSGQDSFTREKAKRLASGQAAKRPVEVWKFDEKMSFLKEHIKPRLSTDEYSAENSEEALIDEDDFLLEEKQVFNDYSSASSGPSSSVEPPPKKRKKVNSSLEEGLRETMHDIKNFLETGKDYDEDELFCASLLQKLKKFPLKAKNAMKIKMLTLLNSKEEEISQGAIGTQYCGHPNDPLK